LEAKHPALAGELDEDRDANLADLAALLAVHSTTSGKGQSHPILSGARHTLGG
jgi:hypothetical protein